MFYPPSGPGQPWNGLTEVREVVSGSDIRVSHVDGTKFVQRRSPGSFAGTIEAYGYPEGFYDDILVQRRPPTFGMSYRTGFSENSKIHLVFNLKISPVGFFYKTSEIDKWSWGFTTTPVDIPGAKSGSHIVIDTSVAYPWAVEALEDILYGSDSEEPRLPLPSEVIDIFEENAMLRIIDNGDGSWTAVDMFDTIIEFPDADSFEITWPSAVYIDPDTYTISSL